MRYLKNVLLLSGFTAALAILCGCKTAEGAEGPGVSSHGALHVDGAALKDEKGNTMVLRGTSSHGITWYPRYLNGGAMETLAGAGANVQRIAMYTEPHSAYIENPEQSLDYLYMGIESALSADMYAIADWHILKDGNPNEYVEEAVLFFDEISRHYGDNPAILYEICNEPNGDTSWEDIRSYADKVIPVIRANAPGAVILVGTPKYCTDFSGPIEKPLEYGNIMYTMHRYIDVSEEKACENHLIESIVESGVPVFVSEWGTSVGEQAYLQDGGPGSGAITYQENARPFIDYMKEHGISWTAWSLSNKDEAHSMLKSDCQKYSGWTEEDLTDFGILIFSAFR
ncbi:glycoside hydrolase family 5 protein [Clostridium transplantifaecale]|uniref:glycoside hydrolase family 5 protein n=1 Tax=Clostridium transplantifaecale TaxID=2479838 RepID=UPI000F6419AE|nr:glycoside hydrolase family 5 protein [Clostridium transplantifaecale]